MIRLNLLPWREQRRKEQDKRLIRDAAMAWAVVLLVLFYAYMQLDAIVAHQRARNSYLQQQIALMATKIHKIALIKKKRAALLARMNVIQQLQTDRMMIVHSFNSLARDVPPGVYLVSLGQKGEAFTISGVAQSNERVSQFMRNLAASPWFTNPVLDVITVKKSGAGHLSYFTLTAQGKGMAPIKKPVARRG
ncbi:PilN domain-containing protein [Acidiferrobacter sp.]|uniref:PilN domain-containing protein n=1 Tax=Acidiferrobacter sp. TaxID=1872107 RepID=UPI00261F2219|nr:PilN domain-containing protein [Acidiferrobacter sp.]